LWLYSHSNAWANLHILGQPNTFFDTDVRHEHGRAPGGALWAGRRDVADERPAGQKAAGAASEKDAAKLAQKLGQLQPFIAVLPQECMG
jgi:hypothetical protein